MASSPVRMVPGFTMSGGGFGISGPTPAWAGYLGKSQDTSVLSETCPWCEAKGQTVTLRTYAINHEETIRLCPSPMCIFPLVSRPLEAVLASLSSTPTSGQCYPDQTPSVPNSLPSSLVTDQHQPGQIPDSPELVPPSAKRPRAEGPLAKACSVETDGTAQDHDGSQMPVAQNEDHACVRNGNDSVCSDDNGGMVCASPEVVNTEAITTVTIAANHKRGACVSTTEERSRTLSVEEPVTKPSRSSVEDCASPRSPPLECVSHLSWLNALLVALVQCKTLRKLPTGGHKKRPRGRKRKNPGQDPSPVLDLCARYEGATAPLLSNPRKHKESTYLQDAKKKLADVRSSALQLLQQPLQKKHELTRRPVQVPAVVLPALLQLDSGAQELFQHSVKWSSQCQACGCSSNSSCTNTVTAWTHLVSNWHPLSSPVKITCSRCQSSIQEKILQERVPPVFALHFVDGLLQNDVTECSFGHADARYAVTVVIQHKERESLFISWARQPDGSWIAYHDFIDTKGTTHLKLDIPAKEIHMVFWEIKSDDSHQTTACAPGDIPSSTDCQTEEEGETVPLDNASVSYPHEDTFVEALKPSDPDASTMDASIGSATLLDTFEGLSHSDIVMLALEQVKEEDEGQKQTEAQAPVALEGTAEPSVPEEVTTVSSPTSVRRSRRLQIKRTMHKEKQSSSENDTLEEEDTDPSGQKTPQKKKTTPQRHKIPPVDVLSPTAESLTQNSQATHMPVGQASVTETPPPQISSVPNPAMFQTTAVDSLPPDTIITLNLDIEMDSEPHQLQEPEPTLPSTLQTLKVQEPTKAASANQNPELKTPTKLKREGQTLAVQNPAGIALQNPVQLTGTPVQNPAQLTGTVMPDPTQLMESVVQNQAQISGTVVQKPKQQTMVLKAIENPKDEMSSANLSLLSPGVLTSAQLLQREHPTFSENLTLVNPQSKIQMSQTPASQNSVEPAPVMQNINAQSLERQNPIGQTPTMQSKPAETVAMPNPTMQTLATQNPNKPSLATQNPTKPSLATQNPTKLSLTENPAKPSLATESPAKPSLATENPAKPSLATQNPAKPSLATENPAKPSLATQNPAKPSLATENPAKPSLATENPTKPSLATENPTKPSLATENPTKPSLATENPTKPSLATENPTKPSLATENPTKPGLATENLTKPGLATHTPTKPSLATQTPTKPSLATQTPTKQTLLTHYLSVQTPAVPNSRATHMPAVPSSTGKPPQVQPTQSTIKNLPPETIIPLDLDIEMNSALPDELQVPDIIPPSVVTPHPQRNSLPLSTSVETSSVVTSRSAHPSSCSFLSKISDAPKQKPSPLLPSNQPPSPPQPSQQRSTKTTIPLKALVKHNLDNVMPVKPHMFSGFKFQQKGASTSSSSQGGADGLPPDASQKLTPGKMATRPAAVLKAPAAAGGASLGIKKDPDQALPPEDMKTAALRLKLLKKLQAKKKKLAKLDHMMRQRGMVPQSCSAPPSVACSTSTDTSPELLSPSTPSSASSDGADMLEMLASGRGDELGHLMATRAPEKPQGFHPSSAPFSDASTTPAADFLNIDDFLDDVIFDTGASQKAIENDFDTLDMFI